MSREKQQNIDAASNRRSSWSADPSVQRSNQDRFLAIGALRELKRAGRRARVVRESSMLFCVLFCCVLARQGVVRRSCEQQGCRSWDIFPRPSSAKRNRRTCEEGVLFFRRRARQQQRSRSGVPGNSLGNLGTSRDAFLRRA